MSEDTFNVFAINCFVVSGPIGAGKTTLMRQIQRFIEEGDKIRVYFEPVDKWQPYLEALERCEKGAAYCMQMAVLDHFTTLTRELEEWSESLNKRHKRGIALIERSPWDNIYVFLPANQKRMDLTEYQECYDRAQRLSQEMCWRSCMRITLMADFVSCSRRIRRRCRAGEQHLPDSYIQNVIQMYANDSEALILWNSKPWDLKTNASKLIDLLFQKQRN